LSELERLLIRAAGGTAMQPAELARLHNRLAAVGTSVQPTDLERLLIQRAEEGSAMQPVARQGTRNGAAGSFPGT
jgi:hypothetical protein